MPDGSSTETEQFVPTQAQQDVITSDAYPMRVMAGAGTGKTFTMVRKIEALLDDGVSPEEILALTFTNKAADSIREKLVEELGAPGNDVDAYTYHSIGETILRDRPYEVGLDPRYEIATEVDQLELVYESLDEIDYQFTNPRVAAPDEWGAGVADQLSTFIPQMKGEGFEPAELRAYLGSADRLLFLEQQVDRLEDRAAELLDYGRWKKPSVERLAEDMIDPLEEFSTELADVRAMLQDDGLEQDISRYLMALEQLCADLIELFETRQDEILDDGPLNATFRLPALLFNAKYNDHDATGLPKLDTTPMDRLRAVVEDCQTAFDLTKGYVAYQHKLRSANLVDFGDLVAQATGLLKDDGSDLPTNQGGNSWKYVFCDEFQDTDTIQFDLVSELVGDENLFVVGDIFQAIYEWRGANTENIESRLVNEFQPTDFPLEDNFRSNRAILQLANDALADHPAYETVSQLEPGTQAQEVDRGVVTIQTPEAESNRKTIDEEGEAVYITEGIRKLLHGDSDLIDEEDLSRLDDDDREDPESYRPEDIAILVRAKNHARPIIRQLEARGIPYSLGGSLAAESLGVRTVIAYLKILSNPERDDSLNRVLRMRYRLHDADLRFLNRREETVAEALLDTAGDDGELREPDRVAQARGDLEYLLSIRDSHSLVGLYDELKDRTDIERFLSQRDRTGLEHLDAVIQEYGRDRVQPELSEQFIEFLRYNATTVLEGSGGVKDQPDTTEGAVNIMTVHKSKGLEFPVVFLPRLSARGWDPQQNANAGLRHALGDPTASPFDAELFSRDAYEQRRAFHVAVTRAELLCVLSGRAKSDDEDDELSRSVVRELLPEDLSWCTDSNTFPIWETIQQNAPASTVSWTDELQESLAVDHSQIETESGDEILLDEAYELVLEAADAAVAGSGEAIDPATFGLPQTPTEPAPVDLLPTHSYTSIRTYNQCPYRHYLTYVVNAIEDPEPSLLGDDYQYTIGANYTLGSESGDSASVSMRDVGILFHWVAERADQQSYATTTERRNKWKSLVDDHDGYSDPVKQKVNACIDAFFAIPEVTSWKVLSTERSFDLTYDDNRIVGKIDAVCETEDGERIVVDYKTGGQKRPADIQYQLPIYLYAANERDMIGDVSKAVYVYVNDELDTENRLVERDADDSWVTQRMRSISATIENLEQTTYETAAPHATPLCYECGHRSLPCSVEFELESVSDS